MAHHTVGPARRARARPRKSKVSNTSSHVVISIHAVFKGLPRQTNMEQPWCCNPHYTYVVPSLFAINSDTQQKRQSLKDQFPLVQKVAGGKCVTTCDNWPYQHCKVFIFLALQDSSKGDIFTQWVWQWVIFSRCRRRMWPFWQRQRY